MRHYEFSNHMVDLDKVCGVGPVFEDEGSYYFLVYFEGFCLLSQSFKITIEASTGRDSFIKVWSD